MEGKTGHSGGQALLVGLLTAAAVACATLQDPPGGPPDPEPPVLLLVTPDSGAVVDGFEDELAFQFDEVVQERGIDDLVEVSPRHELVDVRWRRSRITVRPDGGWRDSTTYRVTLLPGVSDLRNNRLDSGRTVVFSTGGPIPDTRIAGRAVDWEAGRLAPRALVEVIRPADSLTYVAVADSSGAFELQAVPPGTYLLSAAVDQNNNGRRESRESFDTVTVTLDSSLSRDLWMFPHDTVGPRIQSLTLLDSVSIGVEYDQPLAPADMGANDVRILLLPDSLSRDIDGVFWRATYDSLTAARRDSIAAAADSAAAAADTAAADTAAAAAPEAEPAVPPAAIPQPPPPDSLEALEALQARQDSAEVNRLLAERPRLTRSVVIVMTEALAPGERYVVETTAANLLGVAETSQRVLPVPAAPDSS